MRPAVCKGAAGSQGHRHTDLGRLRVRVGKEGGVGGQPQQQAAACGGGRRRQRRQCKACSNGTLHANSRIHRIPLQQPGRLERAGRAGRRPVHLQRKHSRLQSSLLEVEASSSSLQSCCSAGRSQSAGIGAAACGSGLRSLLLAQVLMGDIKRPINLN